MEEETSNGKVEPESPKVGRHDRDEKQEANQVSAELKPEVGAGNSLLVNQAQQVDGAEQESCQIQTVNLEEDEEVLVSGNTALVPVETLRSSSPLAEEPSEDEHVLVSGNTTLVPVETVRSSSPLAEEPSEDEHVLVYDNTTLVPVETLGSSSSLAEELRGDVQVQVEKDEPTQVPSVEGEVGFSEMNLDEQEIPIVEENPAEPSAQSSEEAPVNQDRDLPPETTNHSPIRPLTQPTLQRTSWRSCCGLLQVLRGSET